MKTLVILRGISGSGKSTKAKELAEQNNGVVHSTDDYFICPLTKQYVFVVDLLKQAHEWNRRQTTESMKNGSPFVIVDNTNTQKWEYQPYIEMAKKYGYSHYQLVCTGSFQNVHGVPEEAIKRMTNRFEIDEDLEHWS